MANCIVVCGLQGTGKSTVGLYIAERIGARVFRSDEIRKEQTATPSYSQEARDAVYGVMMERAEEVLRSGRDVILDATFARLVHREQARTIAQTTSAKLTLLYIVCSEEVIEERLNERVSDASDAKFAQYLTEKKRFESPEENESHVIIDTSQEWSTLVSRVISQIRSS